MTSHSQLGSLFFHKSLLTNKGEEEQNITRKIYINYHMSTVGLENEYKANDRIQWSKGLRSNQKKAEHFPSFEEETRSAALKLRILS